MELSEYFVAAGKFLQQEREAESGKGGKFGEV